MHLALYYLPLLDALRNIPKIHPFNPSNGHIMLKRLYDIRQHLRYTKLVILHLWGVIGKGPLQCIGCDNTSKFIAYGQPPRYSAKCPHCGSLERHRLLILLDKRRQLFHNKKVLHFAPEPLIANHIKPKASLYMDADLFRKSVAKSLNIEAIDEADNTWDMVVASHVLEHVDDKRALKELYRILKKGGILLVMVPMVEAWETSYENPDVTTPEQRFLHYGQEDHVRIYGRDLITRIKAAGFHVEAFLATGAECVEFGLMPGEKIYICNKNA
jgi:SAM-dependent methyltransferase